MCKSLYVSYIQSRYNSAVLYVERWNMDVACGKRDLDSTPQKIGSMPGAPTPSLQNVVATFDTGQGLDLANLAKRCCFIQYTPKKFAAGGCVFETLRKGTHLYLCVRCHAIARATHHLPRCLLEMLLLLLPREKFGVLQSLLLEKRSARVQIRNS